MKQGRTVRALGAPLFALIFGVMLLLFPMRTRAVAKGATKAAAPASLQGKASEGALASASVSAKRSDEVPVSASAHAPPQTPTASQEHEVMTLPRGKGLPLIVGTAVFFLDVSAFDDTKGEFDATTDVRYRWIDLRQRFSSKDTYREYKELRGKDAEEYLGKIWTPNVEIVNRVEISGYVGRRLRLFPDGRVELIVRTTSKYKTKVDPQRFPFDRQFLVLDLIVREATTDEVVLRFSQEDVGFSRASGTLALEGWSPGLVEPKTEIVAGWNGDRYSRATVALVIDRMPTTGLAPIFIPLMASLLIPLLVVWMNRTTEDGFEIEAFELANMGIGGLFSVIALSFAIYSAYGVLAGSDNTVTRLFGLNYATLALSLAIVVVFFRYNLPRRLWGRYVHEELFAFVAWSLPVLTLCTSIAFLLAAAA